MQNVACTTERDKSLLVFVMGSLSFYEGVQILAELIEVLLPLCTSLVDPLFGQAECLGLDPTGADAADFRRTRPTFAERTSPEPSSTARCCMTAGSDIASGRANLLTEVGPRASWAKIDRRVESLA